MEKEKINWQMIIPIIVLVISLVIFIIAFQRKGNISIGNHEYTLKITEVKWNKSGSYAPAETEFTINEPQKLKFNGCYNENVHFEISKFTRNGVIFKSNKPLEKEEFELEKNKKLVLKTTDKDFWCTYEFKLS